MRQYESADNMTDRMAALSTLSLHDVPERAAALDDFYRRFETDPLVIDKWFSLQAMIPEAETLERVRALTAHPAFSFANPNRVRSLIGAFAQANQTQFNRADGAGYDFVADTVLALDRKNPQVAARLLARVQELARARGRRGAPAPRRRCGGSPRRTALARRQGHRRRRSPTAEAARGRSLSPRAGEVSSGASAFTPAIGGSGAAA